jgi:hypothetical protein
VRRGAARGRRARPRSRCAGWSRVTWPTCSSGPTSGDLDLTAPVVSLNLRAVYESDALSVLMVCAASWLKREVDLGDGVKRILVVDEAWAVLGKLEVRAGCRRAGS